MQTTRIAVATNQRVAIGIEEQQLRRERLGQVVHRLLKYFRRLWHITYVNADGSRNLAFGKRASQIG
ncbi:hypothetical protein SDC9_142080 [bioreactor metagenome]|uniref:Uncharacterized protein n=1 Tax=bioreactor metagenome TaxID=1076179 RepID=A0A645E050_9ZZZZ